MNNNLLTLFQALSHLNAFNSSINTSAETDSKSVKYHPIFTDKVIEEQIVHPITGDLSITYYQYDSVGNLVRTINSSTNSKVGYVTEICYNSNNQITNEDSFEIDSELSKTNYDTFSNTYYEYNSHNDLVSIKNYKQNKLVYEKLVEYGASGPCETYKSYNKLGELISHTETDLDTQDRVLFEKDYISGEEITYQYNNDGKLVHKSNSNGDWETLQYDEQGRFIYSQCSEISDSMEIKCRYIDNLCIGELYRHGELEDSYIDDLTTNKRICQISGNTISISHPEFSTEFDINNIKTVFRNITIIH